MDNFHEKIAKVGHLMENDVDTLHEERNHLMGFNFIRVIDAVEQSKAIHYLLKFTC